MHNHGLPRPGSARSVHREQIKVDIYVSKSSTALNSLMIDQRDTQLAFERYIGTRLLTTFGDTAHQLVVRMRIMICIIMVYMRPDTVWNAVLCH